MSSEDRFVSIRDGLRAELGISDCDIDDIIMSQLFDKVLEAYSRFRGQRSAREITFVSAQKDYDLESQEWYLLDIYYNDTYPTTLTTSTISELVTEERYDYPSLKIIDAWKQRMAEDLASVDEAEYNDYFDGDDHKLHVEIDPITNIVVVARALFNRENFPVKDQDILESLYQAKVIGRVLSIPQVATLGDLTYSIKDMRSMKKEAEKNFYRTMQISIGRS